MQIDIKEQNIYCNKITNWIYFYLNTFTYIQNFEIAYN